MIMRLPNVLFLAGVAVLCAKGCAADAADAPQPKPPVRLEMATEDVAALRVMVTVSIQPLALECAKGTAEACAVLQRVAAVQAKLAPPAKATP